MEGEACDQGCTQEGREQQSTIHYKLRPSGSLVKDGLQYITESMPGADIFVERSSNPGFNRRSEWPPAAAEQRSGDRTLKGA